MIFPRPAPLADKKRRTAQNKRFRELGIPQQACNTCFAVKPHAAFARKSNAPSGRAPQCRVCHSAYQVANAEQIAQRMAEYYRANADRAAQRMAEWCRSNAERNADRVRRADVNKACVKCGEIKPETAFSLNRRAADGLRHKCRECDTPAYRRTSLAAHGDGIGAPCYLCGATMTDIDEIWVDHIIPQSAGGSDEADNLRPTHKVCNIRKNDRPATAEQLARLTEETA